MTALVFDIGKFWIGFYIGKTAGSGVVILAWVYYSSQLIFLGAEFTQVYAKHRRLAPVVERPPAA